MKKKWNILEPPASSIEALQQSLKIDPTLCRLLINRNICSFEEARRFFRPSLEKHLHDPFAILGMSKAVARLHEAITNQEPILLFGDYDVDGTTAVALLFTFLQQQKANVSYYLPDREKEGYGLSEAGLETARKKGVKLLIALDCGTKDFDVAEKAKSYNIDLLICDHHTPGVRLPPCHALINPKQKDCLYPFKELTGCGLAWKLANAYSLQYPSKRESIWALLDLVAISIACDIVPITGENRVLAFHGLQQLNQNLRPGISALLKESGSMLPLCISDLVFGIGPYINAAGRMAHAANAVALLIETDQALAISLAKGLAFCNALRKSYDQRITEEAIHLVKENPNWQTQRTLVLHQSHWHKGVVGIVASRMVERFHRPTIVLTDSEGQLVGSARSIKGFDLSEALDQCSETLLAYGGHTHAAGLRMNPYQLWQFSGLFETIAAEHLSEEALQPVITIDAPISLHQLSPRFWKILKQFAPFGPGNRSPVFVAHRVVDAGYSRVVKEKHLKLTLRQNDSSIFHGIAFDQAKFYDEICDGQSFDIAFSVKENNWNGNKSLQLIVKDIKINAS